MYREYYRLKEDPFNITPDPRFLYLTPRHQEALDHLLFGIRQRKGFICLTGEVGAGKTTLCRKLLNELDPSFHTALILNPVLTETQLLRAVVDEFGIETKRRDRLGYMQLLNQWLLKVNSEGQDAVLIIDEMQDMPDKTIEMTRLLSNLETMSQKLVQIVLVGQPELRDKLAKGKFRQLAQRITVRFHLGNMSRDETRQYVQHRLHVASGGNGEAPIVRFDDRALDEVYRHSYGTPRLVNAICDKSLLAGYVHQTGLIDRALVRRAIQELKEAG